MRRCVGTAIESIRHGVAGSRPPAAGTVTGGAIARRRSQVLDVVED
jgi:hypothetical protein